MADILLENGASLTLEDINKNTPFSICMEKDNIKLLEKLISGLSLNSNPQILHSFKNKILNVQYQEILKTLLNNDPPTEETMNALDDLGLTPFLNFVEYFCSRFVSLRSELMILVNAESKKHKTDFSKYEITNATLFKKAPPENNRNRGRYGGGFGGGFGGGMKKAAKRPNGWGGQEDEDTDVFQDAVSIEERTKYTDNLME